MIQENLEEEKSGHRDVNGNWIDEALAARLRNKLSVFWTLSTMLADEDMSERLFSDPKIQQMVIEVAKTCENNKEKILDLISQLAVIENSKDLNNE